MFKVTVKDIDQSIIDAIPEDKKSALLTAHAEWNKAEQAIPDEEWKKGYRYRTNVARKKWDTFRNICISLSLEPARTGAFLNI